MVTIPAREPVHPSEFFQVCLTCYLDAASVLGYLKIILAGLI